MSCSPSVGSRRSTFDVWEQSSSKKSKKSNKTKRNRVKEKHKCEICEKELSTKGNLVQHMATHADVKDDESPPPTFDCSGCGKRFLQKRYLLNHEMRCSSIKTRTKKTLNCSLCGKIFVQAAQLRRHESHHLRQNMYRCSICDRGFVQRYHLDRHYRSTAHLKNAAEFRTPGDGQNLVAKDAATGKPNFGNLLLESLVHKCFFCPKAFSSLWEMQRHWRTIHPYAVRRTQASGANRKSPPAKITFILKCTRCRATFDNDLLYRNHLEWHQGKRKHKCDICDFSFPRRLEFDNHRAAKHGVGWMFECVECGRRFPQRTTIDRHLKNSCSVRIGLPASDEIQDSSSCDSTRGPLLQCKYCGAKTIGIDDYRDHTSNRHFRKIFVDNAHLTEQLHSPNKANSIDGQNSNEVQLIVNIGVDSRPVRVLHLAPFLPKWLLKLQPSFGLLDVSVDDSDQPLTAGGSIVVQLPLSDPLPVGSIKSRTITISYSE